MAMWKGLIESYQSFLPVTEKTPRLSLREGNTPLIPLEKLSDRWGVELYVKYEGANPTGSFKDRGMVIAVAKAKEEGSETIICASTGNTSASAAAYGTRAGLRTVIVIPEGKIALGKLAQATILGADIYAIRGNFDQALEMVRSISQTERMTLVNSVNPYRLEGQKTAAFEVCDQLGEAPDVLAIPVGNAGNISAYWKGFKEYHEVKGTGLPQMRGFEAEGAAAIVRNQVIPNPETIATAIRIGNPASWHLAVDAAESSQGKIDEVTDQEILEAYRLLAQTEGVFAEPASCASIAGVKKQLASGEIKKGAKVVAVLTGNGLKDPTTAIDAVAVEPTVIDCNEAALIEQLRKQSGVY
ncbi:threonine synthase [Pullulanibacillus camelliae]|uniref:Threonine synthase n=1 Tax=Pullulanibacillus camelliae TaxID=1707096 RepID=A0A8J2VY30_9BACL|nr:threonine synthase [Pullulanibacillus camelliae]GGE40522.1 threonine synthase [Pullulanibacillus camelliae]